MNELGEKKSLISPAQEIGERSVIKALGEVTIALTTERNHEKLLSLILERARFLSQSDAGSLYLIEKQNDEPSRKHLRFVLAQNDSTNIKFEEKIMPLSEKSIAGFVAVTGEILLIKDAYKLPKEAPYSHNKNFDKESGYRAKSMLVLPMINSRGEIIGVLQLINRKKDFGKLIKNVKDVDDIVIDYSENIVQLMRSFSSMAAVAIENNQLIKSIERLFEGMVEASVTAVEQRDPTTSGHSLRVSILTLALAEAVNLSDTGKFKDYYFNEKDMRQIRYASILHDFGKIGVRENVLVKEKKLYPHQLDSILARIEIATLSKEKDSLYQIVDLMKKNENGKEKIESIIKEIQEYKAKMTYIEDTVKRCNEPTVLPEGDFRFLQDLAKITFVSSKGEEKQLLLPEEIRVLSIPKGTLTDEERLEIESHVTHTFEFLKKIPWTEELKNIPEIAYAHHEKLNGCGYPRRLDKSFIPLPSMMMAVSDIFDALSAADRPYKKAVPIEKTLDILLMEAKSGQLDIDLVNLFIEAKVFEKTLHLRRVSKE
ncbi:MAG: GAF domain-containing protein [Acidobacteria bacterium]|nr:GAF domain-containing protein [Acidobacteriota bacterium]